MARVGTPDDESSLLSLSLPRALPRFADDDFSLSAGILARLPMRCNIAPRRYLYEAKLRRQTSKRGFFRPLMRSQAAAARESLESFARIDNRDASALSE